MLPDSRLQSMVPGHRGISTTRSKSDRRMDLPKRFIRSSGRGLVGNHPRTAADLSDLVTTFLGRGELAPQFSQDYGAPREGRTGLARSRGFKNGRKDQDSAALRRNDTAMLRTFGISGEGDTVGRLRRGLIPAQGSHAVDAMARAACFSRRQFHRLMVRVFGETPGTHQRRLRLDRGAWLLLTSPATVLDIALETGFESHETFTRAFRTRFGITPSGFRTSRGATLPRSIRVALSIALHAAT